ncbi:DUF7079 family protein [Stutzerimonas stutzeri]|uniref:DUF7079 family protein n=1 Tax=Stutzerimonas stutzeri TaxID=316 RepID=UPI003C6FDBB9
MSDVFVDNSVDYVSIARHLNGYGRSTIETAFFLDVAPACFSNLQAAIPSAWTAPDSAGLLIRSLATLKRVGPLRSGVCMTELSSPIFAIGSSLNGSASKWHPGHRLYPLYPLIPAAGIRRG